MEGPVHVYLVGAHATGKTTLARWIRDSFGLPMISEVARGVLAEMEERLDSLRTDVELVSHYQSQVLNARSKPSNPSRVRSCPTARSAIWPTLPTTRI